MRCASMTLILCTACTPDARQALKPDSVSVWTTFGQATADGSTIRTGNTMPNGFDSAIDADAWTLGVGTNWKLDGRQQRERDTEVAAAMRAAALAFQDVSMRMAGLALVAAPGTQTQDASGDTGAGETQPDEDASEASGGGDDDISPAEEAGIIGEIVAGAAGLITVVASYLHRKKIPGLVRRVRVLIRKKTNGEEIVEEIVEREEREDETTD